MLSLAGAVTLAVAGLSGAGTTGAWAQAPSWNLYGDGGSFYVPITLAPSPRGGPPQLLVSLTLNGYSQPSDFILDTGSLGLVADPNHYTPGNDPVLAPYATITYTTSGDNPVGSLYLTNVQINGANGQSVIARVPILGSTNYGYRQLGVGFDRGGISIGQSSSGPLTPANNSYNMNPFLALVSGPGVSTMQPGYIIGMNGFSSLGLGPGVLLGLTSQNTSGYAFQQLASNGGLPSYCSVAGMNCPLQWSAQTGAISVTTGGQTYDLGSLGLLPDSGISYMIVNAPGNNVPVGPGNCSDGSTPPNNCLQSGRVEIFLPGQTQAAYSFRLDDTANPSVPFGVQITQGAGVSNLGRTFFENLNYLYDPINGFVGFQAAGTTGTDALIIPMLALQGTMTLPDGFLATFPTFLMSGLTVQQTGSGGLNGPITGPGGLILQSGNFSLGGTNNYSGGTTVNGGTLTIAGAGSIVGDVTVNSGGRLTNNGTIGGNGLLTVNAGGAFTNNGTVNTPLQWQLNQGTFTNNGTFIADLANTGTASNAGTLTGSLINGNTGVFGNTGTINGTVSNMGMFANNGSVTGNFANMGMLSGNGTIGGNLVSSGVLSPGNSVGTITVAGNFTSTGGTYVTEVTGQGQSDRMLITGTANLQGGQVAVNPVPGQPFAPVTRYTIVSAAGGVSGAFSGVNSTPFLRPSLSYDANNVYLTLQIGGFGNAAQNPLQQGVGNALDSTASTAVGDYALVLGTLAGLAPSQVQAILTSLSGANYAGFSSSMVQGAQLFMSNFASQAGRGGAPGGNRVALAEACDVACDTTMSARWGAWGGAVGGLGTIGAGTSLGAVTYNAGGFAAGLDRAFADSFRAGVAVGYSAGTQWVSGFSGQGNTNTVQFGLYGNYADGPVYADALFGYAYSSNQMTRQIVIPGLASRTAWGQAGANQFFGQLEAGYRIDIGTRANAYVTPFARLQAYTGTQNGFTETGAQSLNLSVAQQTTNSLRSVIGAQIGSRIDLGWREKLALQLRLGWSHEYADVSRPVTAALAGAPGVPFTSYGVSPTRDGVLLGFAADTAVAEATSLYLRYEGTLAGQDGSHALTAGVRLTW
jgi:outer membrane autotransporter protein